MTQQIIEKWSQIRGLDYFHAMLELRFLGDILASNKKNSEYTESKEMKQTHSILSEVSANGNQAAHHYNAS